MHNPEHRVQTTKKLLRDALMTLLAEKPLRSITVKELCLRAKLNRGTFYAHYADVYDLLDRIEAEMEADFSAALAPMLSAAGQMTPPKVTKKVFECIEANADLCRVTIGPFGDKEFARKLIRESKISVVQSCRQYFPDADEWQINAYYTFISGGCFALMERWIREGMVESPEVLANAAEQIMESGAAFLRRKS
jgi:AcrR family transcriptional regulator